jgi:hypothetical protein
MKARNDFFLTLSAEKFYTTFFRTDEEEKRTLFKGSFPKDSAAMILHRRMFKCSEKPFDFAGNYCFEATLLDSIGNVKHDYEKAFLDLPLVSNFVARSKSNLIINLMKYDPKTLSLVDGELTESPMNNDSSIQLDDTPSSHHIHQYRCPHLSQTTGGGCNYT